MALGHYALCGLSILHACAIIAFLLIPVIGWKNQESDDGFGVGISRKFPREFPCYFAQEN